MCFVKSISFFVCFDRLVIEWRFVARVKEQMSSFLEGFGSICPLALLKIFDENELELLMCGIQNIGKFFRFRQNFSFLFSTLNENTFPTSDVKDWKKNTLYKGDYYANHLIVQWFWRVSFGLYFVQQNFQKNFSTGGAIIFE